MSKLTLLIVGMAVVMGIVLGCGSGEDDATSASLTKPQFVKEANRVCKKFKEERRSTIVAWEKEFPQGEVPVEKIDDGLKRIVAPSLKQEAEALKALATPEGEGQKISRMIANLSGGSSDLASEGEAGVSDSTLPKFAREATAYGLETCATL